MVENITHGQLFGDVMASGDPMLQYKIVMIGWELFIEVISLVFATPKPSQSSKFSLEGFIISTSPPPPPPPLPNLFDPRAFKPGQGLPRQLGTSNLISRTLAKLKAKLSLSPRS